MVFILRARNALDSIMSDLIERSESALAISWALVYAV